MKRYSIKVKTNVRKNEVKELDANTYEVRVTAPPVDGKANEKMIEALTKYFGKPKRCVRIIRGATSKMKIVEVEDCV